MKRFGLTLLATLAVTTLLMAAPKARTFTGDIMDSGCAMMGSHAQMEKMHHMKPSSALTGKEARMCTLACVKQGGKFVLYDPASKTVYNLDNQVKPRKFAGEKVKVTGTYDAAAKTIHVESIHAAAL